MNPATSSELSPLQRSLMDQAADWRLLGLLFECPHQVWREYVGALGRETRDSRLRKAAEAALAEASEGLYHSIFGPGGPAPAREVSYHDSVELGYLMSEIEATYSAFAYRPTLREAPDHIAIEVGFIAYLRLKEAYAVAGTHEDAPAITADAAREFLNHHLSVFAEPLASILAESRVHYLALAGEVLRTFVGPRKTAHAFPVLGQGVESDCEIECGRIVD